MFIQMPKKIRKFSSHLQISCYLNICHNRKNSFCSSSWLRKIHILIQSSCKLEGTPKFVLSRPLLCIGSLQPLDLVDLAFLHSKGQIKSEWIYKIINFPKKSILNSSDLYQLSSTAYPAKICEIGLEWLCTTSTTTDLNAPWSELWPHCTSPEEAEAEAGR